MRTIGRRWPSQAPRGDRQADCEVCGVRYRRSQLCRMPGGALACRGGGTLGCGDGRDALTLDRLNAARSRPTHDQGIDGGSMTVDDDYEEA